MVEGLRHGTAVCLLLQIVVTDLSCGVERLFDVAILQRAKHLVVVVGPNACEEVGLKFETHTDFVRLFSVTTIFSHLLMSLAQDTQFVLHVVAYLVSDNVGVCKVAIGTDLFLHALKELQVKIHSFVGRAIEWSTGRRGITAARTDSVAEDNHLRRVVSTTQLRELFGPHIFRAGEDTLAEGHQFNINGTWVATQEADQ